MLPAWLPSPRILGALQRVLLVALLTPAVLIALTAAVPALAVLPFLPGGTDRAIKLLAAHTRYLSTLLTNSRPAP
ncbi:dTMP kinase [Streptomyces prunicolor]|uniref:dTMP kinase n=1 Tax=Streptomyces prunicolor TaxID=67348 RepID=A0ABU4FIK3_9ACTN|nr:dTMP kinase [Streptomyces prunicolor]MDV7220432.1 dTMP kinase [Streptomyces prunicolor]